MTNIESFRAPQALSRAQFAERITGSWRRSLESVIETGRHLITAKASLDYGNFTAMVDRDLPFGPRTAQQLMAIAQDARIANPNHGSLLPPSWRTLYELTKLDDVQFESRIADGTIRKDMERADIEAVVKRRPPREAVQDDLPLKASDHNPSPDAGPVEMYLRQTDESLAEAKRLASALPLLRVPPSRISKAKIRAVREVAQAWQAVLKRIERRVA
jgi:hypothetical protein